MNDDRLPNREDLELLIREVKTEICDEYLAFEGDEEPGIQLTVATDGESWAFQTGDNSFHGACHGYPHWSVHGIYRDTDYRDVAGFILSDLAEMVSEDSQGPPFDAATATGMYDHV